VTGARLDGRGALEVGLVHRVADDVGSLEAVVDEVVLRILACAPGAVATTKELLLRAASEPLEGLLDDAAAAFAAAARSAEGTEGTMAFLQKRKPSWVPEGDA
jgi:isohexenylglutaconyl-CoA hydratase